MVNGRILIVDDDSLIRNSLYEVLRVENYDVEVASDGLEALEITRIKDFDIVITDIKMPKLDGIALLERIKREKPRTEVVIITSYGSVENAVEAMKYGASDYITKPIIDDEIKHCIRKILKNIRLVDENEALRQELNVRDGVAYYSIIGHDRKMKKIYSIIDMISNTNATVLIEGESGTGKSLIARAIHMSGDEDNRRPFVEVSCGALPETLLESELFGHVKGAFTSAIKDRMGRFELANGGTIFLDEIDTISPMLQVKLLRVLQDKEFERVGSEETKKVDIRIIAATNQDLRECIKNGKFREDLYYRLNVINIKVPPLRERKADIPYLVEHFRNIYNKRFNKNVREISGEVMNIFFSYSWPGNVRELENAIERAIVLSSGEVLTPSDVTDNMFGSGGILPHNIEVERCLFDKILPLKEAIKEPEKAIIRKALEHVGWNRKKAAELLDINRTTLYNKMKEYGLME